MSAMSLALLTVVELLRFEKTTCIGMPIVPVCGLGAATPTGCRAVKVMLSPTVPLGTVTLAAATDPTGCSCGGDPT